MRKKRLMGHAPSAEGAPSNEGAPGVAEGEPGALGHGATRGPTCGPSSSGLFEQQHVWIRPCDSRPFSARTSRSRRARRDCAACAAPRDSVQGGPHGVPRGAASERHSLPTMSCPGCGLHAQSKRTRFRRRLLSPTTLPTSKVFRKHGNFRFKKTFRKHGKCKSAIKRALI